VAVESYVCELDLKGRHAEFLVARESEFLAVASNILSVIITVIFLT